MASILAALASWRCAAYELLEAQQTMCVNGGRAIVLLFKQRDSAAATFFVELFQLEYRRDRNIYIF